MKKKTLLVGALSAILLFTGCGAGTDQNGKNQDKTVSQGTMDVKEANEEATDVSGRKILVGVCLQNMSNEWIAMLKDALEEQAEGKYPEMELIILDGEGDAAKQIPQMEGFINQKCDVVLCNPQDGNMLIPAFKEVIGAGIPVIALGSDCEEQLGQVWIGSENQDGGALQMQYLVDQLGGKGNIAILRGPIGHFAEIGRYEGYESVLKNYPDIQVVYDQSADFSREKGMSVMENWLQTGETIDAVIAQNDEMILGAAKAVEAAGKQDEILLVGLDGISDALGAVKDGILKATMYQDAIAVGHEAVNMAYKVVNGKTIERTNVPFQLVTQENVDDYINLSK